VEKLALLERIAKQWHQPATKEDSQSASKQISEESRVIVGLPAMEVLFRVD